MPGFRRTRPGNQVIAVVDDYLRLYIGGHFEVQAGEERTLFSGPCPAGTYCTYLPLMAAEFGGGPAGVRSFSLPWPGEVRWRSYYFAGGRRIAMRSFGDGQGETGEAVWFLSDHLGSTSLTVDEGGGVLAARRYDPWGSPRDPEDLDDLLTDYTYTGQRSEAALGLMYYVARWYDSGIGHFIQADTIVPGAGNPAAWNRYGYVMYNPMKYVDPSGHFSDQQLSEWFSWLGDDWYQMLPEIYGTELSLLLSSDETDLGDIIQFSKNGDEYFGMFVLSENGTLMLWDISSRESMGLFEVETLIAFYDRKGGNNWRQYETQRIYSEGFIEDGLTLAIGWNNGETQRISVRQPIKTDCSPDYLCYVDLLIAGGTLLIGGVSHNPATATVAVVDMTITVIGVFDATYENQIYQFQSDVWNSQNPYQDCQYYGCQFE